MSRVESAGTVLLIGPGDLGARIALAIGRMPVDRLVVGARDPGRAEAVAGQAALNAALLGGPRAVEACALDLEDADACAEALARIAPSVIVMAASRITWWRMPAGTTGVPYASWLPVQAALVRRLMLARAAAGVSAPVVCLPYPDGVGPVLAGEGLAPELGAGNVLEMASKLAVCAAREAAVPPADVHVSLVAHHAAERQVFPGFENLAGASAPRDPPPLLARIHVQDRPLDADAVQRLIHAPYPLPSGRATHDLTAAAAAATIEALLSEAPRRLHVPAPGGRPGGYPVRVSRRGVELDLPAGTSEDDAIAINSVAARWDGIEHIDPSGAVTFCDWAVAAIRDALGLALERVEPGEMEAVGDEMLARARRAGFA